MPSKLATTTDNSLVTTTHHTPFSHTRNVTDRILTAERSAAAREALMDKVREHLDAAVFIQGVTKVRSPTALLLHLARVNVHVRSVIAAVFMADTFSIVIWPRLCTCSYGMAMCRSVMAPSCCFPVKCSRTHVTSHAQFIADTPCPTLSAIASHLLILTQDTCSRNFVL